MTTCAVAAPAEAKSEVLAEPRLAVVLLTWNARADTVACLGRLVPQLRAGDLLVVSDNGSSDGTESAVRAAFPSVAYVQNGTNLGFAGGVNAGLRRALDSASEWLFVLNNDTEPDTELLARLRAQAASAAPNVGALQPLLVSTADPERIDSAGLAPRALPGARDRHAGEPARSLGTAARPIFGACGAAALYRRSALERVGIFDDALFVLFEDVDLAFRLRAAGYEAWLVPSIKLPHRRGVSSASDGSRAPAARRRRTWVQRNTLALALRYWPWPRLVLAFPILAWRAVDALRLARVHAPQSCLPLWRRAFRERGALRAGLRRAGGDAWFGRDR